MPVAHAPLPKRISQLATPSALRAGERTARDDALRAGVDALPGPRHRVAFDLGLELNFHGAVVRFVVGHLDGRAVDADRLERRGVAAAAVGRRLERSGDLLRGITGERHRVFSRAIARIRARPGTDQSGLAG